MIQVQRRLNASPERVFAVLSNGWLYPSWVVGASRMRDVDPAWPEVGSRLHHSVGVWPVLLDDSTSVLLNDPPRRLVLQARGWPAGEATVDIRLEPDGDGCLVTLMEDATRGPGTLVPQPVRLIAIQPRNRETLKRLAFLAEGQAESPVRSVPRRSTG
jgi:uncharacterized protein YndB with AHSA1/START domain